MKTKRLCTAVACALAAPLSTSHAQALLVPTAAALEQSCRAALEVNLQARTTPVELCAFVMVGYMDGMRAGANRGLRTAFLADQKNLATTNGIEDVQFRLNLIRPKAHCIPPQATTRQVIEVFVNYMTGHAARRGDPFSGPLLDSIESYFCPG